MKKISGILIVILLLYSQITAQDLGSGIVEEERQLQKVRINFWHFWSDPVRKQKNIFFNCRV